MKTLIYAGPEEVRVKEMEVPELKDGQVRIRVKYCGVCGSDIGIYSGKHPRAKAPLVLGHEFVGVIDQIKGSSEKFKIGDRVCAYPLISCGKCFACKTGSPHVCNTLKLIGIDIDGGMAEYVNCYENVLVKLDDSLPDKVAAVVEPLAVVIRTLHQSKFKALDNAVIIGAGPIGILTGIVLKHSGASKIIISDIDDSRLKMCEDMGFKAVNVKTQNLVDCVNDITDNVGADVVFECSGAEVAALDITKVCRIGGTICMTGIHKMPHAVNLQDVNFKEQTIVGSRVYTMREFEQAVQYAQQIKDDIEKIVTHIVPLDSADKVFDLIKNPNEKTVKVIIDCE
ncbi:alcohol dehydrogenase catalytic domain-containing protein [Clostridium bowmanii]|uniref:zinc-dependent alcohol dehydrogenase n=1 Tax=Clostridium bowmanii TaxID=132925 RepID=UPI001C0D360C|nr:alcohol dehydrogenase catalytic domain-containing protein [Clostridium bowmanii]MBU3191945.1 alcohol dehydrogenase catalytic domain-containing protein [Clostridium bowmanii]MCA1074498.1 alcohol dehydrogenase catalytic domain-containing protein [Clostridium bowmanii]